MRMFRLRNCLIGIMAVSYWGSAFASETCSPQRTAQAFPYLSSEMELNRAEATLDSITIALKCHSPFGSSTP